MSLSTVTNAADAPAFPETRIECRSTEPFARWLAELKGTLAFTTYQAGKLAMLGWRDGQPTLLMRHFDKPMGLPVGPGRLALVTRYEITFFATASLLAHDQFPDQPGRYDALHLIRATYRAGNSVAVATSGSISLFFDIPKTSLSKRPSMKEPLCKA